VEPPGTDVQLDAIALIQAHLDRDTEGATAILRNADAPAVAHLLAHLLAGVLANLPGAHEPAVLRAGLDEMRAAVTGMT
jgi:hypothetical protein